MNRGCRMAVTSMNSGRSIAVVILTAAFLAIGPWLWADDGVVADRPVAREEAVDEVIQDIADDAADVTESQPSDISQSSPVAGDRDGSGDTQESDPEHDHDPVAESQPTSLPSCRIRIKLDVAGEIFAPAGRDAPPIRRPISVDARFDFIETRSDDSERSVIRRYRDAAADVRIDGAVRTARLPVDARELRFAIRGAMPIPSLETGYLTREELDLVETPFDPLLINLLLPTAPLAIGDSWSVAADTVAGLLAIDTVESGGLDAKLVDVVDGRATVKLSGIIDGAVDGVPTHAVVEGTYAVAAGDAAGGVRLGSDVTNLAVTIQERREASHVAPGFDVEARLTVARGADENPIDDDVRPAEQVAAGYRRRGVGKPGFVWQRDPAGRYELVHDARWRAIEDGPEGLVMRFVDRGALVAQCSITALPRASSQSPPTIAEVERDLERSLAGQFGRFEHSSEATRSDGVRLVRVVATGRVDGLPFRWIHVVLTDLAGHRLVATCTLEESLEKRFGTSDRELVDGIRFPSDAESTEAGPETVEDEGLASGRQARLPQESRTP